jgi:hypothetical protein
MGVNDIDPHRQMRQNTFFLFLAHKLVLRADYLTDSGE